jgi:hypothetical protein
VGKVRVGNMRLFLRVMLKDGAVTLTPLPDERAYVADVVLLPLAPFLGAQKTNAPRLGEAYDVRG